MKVNMRVQTKPGNSVTDVLVDSAQTLADICDHIEETFNQAEKRYNKQHPEQKITTTTTARVSASATSDVQSMEE